MKSLQSKIVLLMIGAGIILSVISCTQDPKKPGYEYMPDMYRSPSYETNSPNPLFADSMTSRKPVAGTVSRGHDFPFAYQNTIDAYEVAGKELHSPIEKSAANLGEGKRLFEIYCIHCHGSEGKGDGTMVQNGKFPPPPSYSNQLKDLPEGKMFFSITYGKNLMGSHASQLSATERWDIIQYVQTLQKLGGGSSDKATASVDSSKKAAPADTTKANKNSDKK